MKRSPEENKVFCAIAMFYVNKYSGDFDKASEEIIRTSFRKIDVFGQNVVLYIKRPGVLVGKRGGNVDALIKYLGKQIHIREVQDEAEDSLLHQVEQERESAKLTEEDEDMRL